jgi:hypothetical protein
LGIFRLIKKLIGKDNKAPDVRFEKCTIDPNTLKMKLLMYKVEAARGIPAKE